MSFTCQLTSMTFYNIQSMRNMSSKITLFGTVYLSCLFVSKAQPNVRLRQAWSFLMRLQLNQYILHLPANSRKSAYSWFFIKDLWRRCSYEQFQMNHVTQSARGSRRNRDFLPPLSVWDGCLFLEGIAVAISVVSDHRHPSLKEQDDREYLYKDREGQ